MKTAPNNALGFLLAAEGTEPMIVLKITWPGGIVDYFGDKTVNVPTGVGVATVAVSGRIAEMGTISSVVSEDVTASTGAVSVKLIDWDALLYLRMAYIGANIETALVDVNVHFEGGSTADWVKLLSGRIGAPVRYDEKDRTFSFDIVSAVRSDAASTVLTQEDDASLCDEGEGVPFPLAFGYPKDVPATKVRRGPRTVLTKDIDSADTTIPVEDADTFPSGSITLRVGEEYVIGSFSGDTFNVTQRNANKYTNLTTASRPGGDPDVGNPFVIWITDGTKDCTGCFVKFASSAVPGAFPSKQIGFCVAQKGTKLLFEKPWRSPLGKWLIGGGIGFNVSRYSYDWFDSSGENMNQWTTKAGADIVQFGNEQVTYVASEVPASSVVRIRARKQYQKNVAGLESSRLVIVPKNYYTVQLTNSSLYAGETITTIKFDVPLSSLNQGWDSDDIFVTMKSTVGSNSSDQIKWLLQNRVTGVTIDAPSFADVFTAIDGKFRSDCAVITDEDALRVAQDMAWQARCALSVLGGIARLRYISKPPDTYDFILDNDVVRRDSVTLTNTDLEEVKTQLTGTWKKNYAEQPGDHDVPPTGRRLRKRKNVALHGLRRLTRDFWSYQRRPCVVKSVIFWVGRLSRPWRRIECDGLLPTILLEPWDRVRISMADVFQPLDLTCWAHEVHIASKPWSVRLVIWTPVESGIPIVSPFAYVQDAGDAVLADPNPTTSATEFAKVTPVPFTMTSEGLQQAVAALIKKINVNGNSKECEIELYPVGLSGAASGTAHMTILGTPGAGVIVVGKTGLVWRAPNGDYVTDVFAQ